MLTKRNLSYIDNIHDLRKAKKLAFLEIELAEDRLEDLFSNLPLQALGSAVGFVAGAVAKGFQGPGHKEPEPTASGPDEAPDFTQTLKSVGEETAYFALAKLVEKLLTSR
jgi:hypothetical protein